MLSPLPAPLPSAAEAVWAAGQGQEAPALLPTPVTAPATSLPQLLASLGQLPGCSLQALQGRQPAQDAAQATAVLLRCSRAFAAVVHLQRPGGLDPLRVAVLSAAEADAATSASGSGGGSLWAPSRHAIFQLLSTQAAAALQHLMAQQQQGAAQASALELLLLWLATCGDVFSRCSASSGGALLLADPAAPGGGLLPPLHLPWQLGWAELWHAALNPQLRRAEHLQEAA